MAARKALRVVSDEETAAPKTLLEAVEAAFAVFDAGKLAQAVRADREALLGRLTPREREILDLVAAGRSTKEIARALDVSPRTVETHRANLMQKLGLHNTAEIVLYAVRKSLVS